MNDSTLTVIDTRKVQAESVSFREKLRELDGLDATSKLDATLAAQWHSEARQWSQSFKQLYEPTKKASYEAHKKVCAFENKVLTIPEELQRACQRFLARYTAHKKAQAEAEARRQERLFKEQQESLRLVEAEHLEGLGKREEAEEALNRPIPPVSVQPDLEAAKIPYIVSVDVWVPTANEKREVVFADSGARQAFLTWVAENPAFHHLVKVDFNALKKLLTSNRGLVQPPGIVVQKIQEIRNLTKSDESLELDE